MRSQKSTSSTVFSPRICQSVLMISCLFLWTKKTFFQKSETTLSKHIFLNFFVLFPTLSSNMDRNMYKWCQHWVIFHTKKTTLLKQFLCQTLMYCKTVLVLVRCGGARKSSYRILSLMQIILYIV